MNVSAKEIAKALNLSQSTVSLALRNLPGIGDETRQLVMAKAREMGYAKKSFVQVEQPRFITLVLYIKSGMVLSSNAFFSDLIQGIDREAKKVGYQVFVTHLYESQDLNEQIQSLKNAHGAGILLLATEMDEADFRIFSGIDSPIVVLDRYFPEQEVDCVIINNVYGVKRAVRHLIDCGHTRIGYLHSKAKIWNFDERREGYLRGISEFVPPEERERDIVELSESLEGVVADLEAYLSSTPSLPTAFFIDADLYAVPCMAALKRAGYRIPEDVSVIGFDNVPTCSLMDPPLTTMSVPREQLGACAVSALVHRIEGSRDATMKVEVGTSLVVRDSVADRRA